MRKWLLLLLCVCVAFGTLTMVGCSKPAGDDPAAAEEVPPEGQEKEAPGPPAEDREEPTGGEGE